MFIRSLAIGLAVTLFTACTGATTNNVSTGHALAVSSNPRTDEPIVQAGITSGFNLTRQIGIHADFISRTWSSAEPQPGVFALDDLRSYFSFAKNRFSSVLLGIQVLNTSAKATPSDLIGASFDSSQMKSRFHSFLDAIKTMLADSSNHITYLSIGNEVDIYLAGHPSEWGAYTDFYNDALTYAHSIAPTVKVGVTTTFSGRTGFARQIDALTTHSDVVINTYYPLNSSFHALASNSPLRDIPAMVAAANKRPLVLQEVGYPSASRLDSSEAGQADFFRNVFAAWDQSGSSIPFLNVFLLHDLAPSDCQAFAAYYGVEGDDFKAYLCSLGLRHGDDSVKPAWAVFVSEASR